MKNTKGYPSRQEAEAILQWAGDLNPGKWISHSRVAARAAETIASAARFDLDKAYVLGLLHDIGRFEGVRGLHHVIAGYELMKSKGNTDSARICLTHSFPVQHFFAYSGKNLDCTEQEIQQIKNFLEHTTYDEYDRLIQLCDALSLPEGITILDSRLIDVALRHGFNDYTIQKWESIFQLKSYFDGLSQTNLYTLFREEIQKSIFGE